MLIVQPGDYVTYKQNIYLAVDVDASGVQLVHPTRTKVRVSPANVQATSLRPATRVECRDRTYLVTGKGMIVSLLTKRICQWSANDGLRRQITELAAHDPR